MRNMEEVENETEHKRSKDRSPSPGIKSTAVVKYTAFQSPVSYARLQCNTDLNLPPSNYGAALDSYGLKQILTGGTGLSSFRMAHMFPDCVGEVDVIAGAECIKKLLKLPYQPNGTVSMMVHRVENTLLLDDFDVYDYLMKSEWSWLKDFFYENILKTMSEQERRALSLPAAPVPAGLTRQFLSHSVAQLPPRLPRAHTPACITGPYLPEPETKPEEPLYEHLYNRNVHWTFEDIHMLIGSDLPIFGDKDRPCVSLHLRDAREPINVLTGIDYWLDNLMCNVPEVLMCYHLDGIVQKYEPMKTEDLPNMENSKFSPKIIRNVAQNILSFLKSNATKAGHTYWLFKGPHDDVVKLYDLTSLCPDKMDNPFTTPVAMLLYRVARNMRVTGRRHHVRQLLSHVVSLLQESKFPQIVASSRYMLADLSLPADTNPADPHFKDESSDSENEDMEFDFSNETCERDGKTNPETERDDKCKQSDDERHKDSAEREREGNSGPDKDRSLERERDGYSGNDKDRASDRVKEGYSDKVKNNKREKERDTKKDKDGSSEREREGYSGNDKDRASKSEREGDNIEVSSDGNALAVQIRGLALKDVRDRMRENSERKSKNRTKSVESCASRCGAALLHALRGLRALHHITIDRGTDEERERLKRQIITEEQHPKMANPFEPIKMNYEPLKKQDEPKEHNSRSRRRRNRKNSEKTDKSLIETSSIDQNAILIRKEKNIYPSWQEPSRDDNFAWKLHLKTLLYEKICLAYATLAEYSYSNEQYGFSLKYIQMASQCQKLLSNMIIKSKVVDVSCLIGRVGDNYFQLSKHWSSLDQFRKQFETDHETDVKLKAEIEKDMNEEVDAEMTDEFDLDISLPTSIEDAMQRSCSYYRRALASAAARRRELLRRLASVTNELALRHMNNAQQIYIKYTEEEDQNDPKAKLLLMQFNNLSKKSLECLDEATEIFRSVDDQANLALLYCNKGRYLRFKAHCDQGGFSAEKRSLYKSAEELYSLALKCANACGDAVRELVCWELSSHRYTRAVLLQDQPGEYAVEPSEVIEALKAALKSCSLGAGPRQYLYQFRAAMIHHRLASLYHSQYRLTTEDGPKRRTLMSSSRSNYSQAANMFAALEDAHMYLTVQMEHVALLETHCTVSPNLKLKSLQNAIQLLLQCHSIMKLIKDKDFEEKDTKIEETDSSMKSEHSLLSLYENRLHIILRSIIQYCKSKSNKDYEKITEMYKKLYSASLKIKKNDDVKLYASSICDVLCVIDGIVKEYE